MTNDYNPPYAAAYQSVHINTPITATGELVIDTQVAASERHIRRTKIAEKQSINSDLKNEKKDCSCLDYGKCNGTD